MGWKEDIVENYKFGVSSLLILRLLMTEDMYGYQIRQKIKEISGGVIDIKEGSFYGPMYKMEKNGLISSKKELVGEKRFRMYYHIEKEGIEHLNYMLKKYKEIYDGTNKIIKYCEKK